MKRTVLLLLLLHTWFAAAFSQVRMRDLFASTPDSIFPFLTRNNRLDCIDFIENKMPARVKNRLDDVVELRQLTDTYLLLQLSERSTAEMRLFGDSLCCLINTYEGPAADSRVRFFDAMWQPVKVVLPCPSVDDFWQSVPDSLRREADAARRSLADLTLIQGQSSPDEATLTYTLQTGELAEKEKEVAQRFVQPLVFRWDGEAFIPLPTP